ncbi:hypothetical protein ACMBCN_01560 [Candidatus Liberibacter asiaticus]
MIISTKMKKKILLYLSNLKENNLCFLKHTKINNNNNNNNNNNKICICF